MRSTTRFGVARTAVATTVAVLLALPVSATDLSVSHVPIKCIPRDTHAKIEATVAPDDKVQSSRVYFRAKDAGDDWYWIEMPSAPGKPRNTFLPKPLPTTEGIDYNLGNKPVDATEAKTETWSPIVSTVTYCKDQGLTYTESVDTDKIALVIGLVKWGQSAVPSGFLPTGITNVVLPNGQVLTMQQAMQPGATTPAGAAAAASGSSTAAAAGAGAAGGTVAAKSGGSSALGWILGGAAVVGGAIAVGAAAGGDSEDNSSSGGSAAPCNSVVTAGGDTPESKVIELGKRSGTFGFQWNMGGSIPDRMVIVYEGRNLFDTGCTPLTGSQNITYSGSQTRVTVNVTPNCSGPGSGTAWSFTITCP